MSDADEIADEIRADIVATRAELAETADVLAARVNQKARLGARVAAGVAGAAALVLLVKRIQRARRNSKSS